MIAWLNNNNYTGVETSGQGTCTCTTIFSLESINSVTIVIESICTTHYKIYISIPSIMIGEPLSAIITVEQK